MKRGRFLVGLILVLQTIAVSADDDAILAAPPATETPFLSQHATGWFWYKDPPKRKKTARPKPAVTKIDPEMPEVRAFNAFKANLEKARIVALFNPTPNNVERYVQYQTALVNMSSQFADVFQRVVWANPEYDFTQQRPVDAVGLATWKTAQADAARDTLARLARTDVIYFFFRSDCPYCHAFAPILKGFAMATGLQVYPVSLDGGGLPEYPDPHLDQGQSKVLGISQIPAIYLANPAKGEIEPVSFGAISQTELIDRIVTIANPSGDRYVDSATPVHPLTIQGEEQ